MIINKILSKFSKKTILKGLTQCNMSLYLTTKQLIDLIKEVKPDIRIRCSMCWYTHPEYAMNEPYPIAYMAMSKGMHRECDYIDTDTLLDLIQKLFEGIENPTYVSKPEQAHLVWSHWMGYYLFGRKERLFDEADYIRWEQLVATEYNDLNSRQQESDIAVANKILVDAPKYLSTVLIHRYFDYTDGKNLWQKDQELVLLDLINEIKTVYKI